MAESTLQLAQSDYFSVIADFLGWGLGSANGDTVWSALQQVRLAMLLNEAQRIVYFPEPEADGMAPHDWSFLHPTATLDIPTGTQYLKLPDDFGGAEGVMTLLNSNSVPTLIQFVSEPIVRQLYTVFPSATGQPQYVSVVPIKGTTATASQRQQLAIYPTTDADYTAQFQYYILPDAITQYNPFAYGGAAHASTFRAACLKVAENFLDDTKRGDGPHSIEFNKRLSASIGMDRKLKPQTGGRNTDRSDRDYRRGWNRAALSPQSATFDGVAYTD